MATYAATFPGLTGIESADVSLQPGVSPNLLSVVASSSTLPQRRGDLVLTYTQEPTDGAGSPASQTLTLADSLVASAAAITGQPGLMQVTLLDRRWRWAHGHIDGVYNERKADETLVAEKKPSELMSLLLDAMGETGYSVARVVADGDAARPYVDWRGDNPSVALEELCYELGFVVTLDLSGNVDIWKNNDGAPLPPGGHRFAESPSLDSGVAPERVRVACSTTQFECKLLLDVPVGPDVDGSIKPIDDLSWAPAGGFDAADALQWSCLDGEVAIDGQQVSRRELAKRYVYRWWRASNQAHTLANFAPPGFADLFPEDPDAANNIDSLDKLLPLLPYLNSEKTLPDGSKERRRFEVTGVFASGEDDGENTAEGTPWRRSVTLLGAEGVVVLGSPALRNGPDGETLPADLRLRCVVEVDNFDNPQKLYYGYTTDAQAGGVGVRTIDHPEIEFRVTPAYTGDTVDSVATNAAQVDAEAAFYANAELGRFTVTGGETVGYEGLRPLALDGIRRRVRWSIGGGSVPRTTVSYGFESTGSAETYAEYQDRVKRFATERKARRDQADRPRRERKQRMEAV